MSELQNALQIPEEESFEGAMDDIATATQFAPPALKQQESDYGYTDAIQDIAKEDWFIANAVNWMLEDSNPFDPDFNLTNDHFDRALDEGVSLSNIQYLRDAHSEYDFENLKDKILEEQEIDRNIGQLGGGTALRLGMNFLDPAGILVSAASGGYLAPAVFGTKLSKLQKVLTLTGVGAAENAALEYGIGLNKATWSPSDMVTAAVTGGVISGAVGGMVGRQIDKANANIHKQEEVSEVAAIARQSGKTDVAEELEETLKPKVVTSDAGIKLTREDVADAPGYLDIAGWKIPMRFDMMFHVLNSRSKTVQDKFFNIAQNVLGDTRGGKVVATGATEAARVMRQSYGWVFNTISSQQRIFDAELSTLGASSPNAMKSFIQGGDQNLFTQLVEMAVVRADDYIDNLSMTVKVNGKDTLVKATEKQKAAIREARDRYRDITKSVHDEAAKYGVDGFGVTRDADGKIIDNGVPQNPNYVHRRLSSTAIPEWKRKLRDAGVEEKNIDKTIVQALAEAYKRGAKKGEEITDAEALKVARLYYIGVSRAAEGNFINFGVLSRANMDALKKHLRDISDDNNIAELDDEAIEDALSILTKGPTTSKGSAVSRRFQLDETTIHSLEVTDSAGRVKKVDINIEDLYDRNAYGGLDKYLREMTGRIAAAKHMNIKSDKDFDDIIDQVKKDQEAAVDQKSKNSIGKDIRNVTTMYRHLTGRPIDKGFGAEDQASTFKFAARILQDYNYIRVMNQVGFAQIAEIYNIAALMGWKAMLANMPTLRAMRRDLQQGKIIKDELMRDIESITGIGAEYSRYATVSERYTGTADEVIGLSYTPGQQRMLHRADQMKRVTSHYLSGMTPITIMTQRLAAKAAIHRMARLSQKPLNAKDYMRFRDLGWDDKTTDAILAQLKKGTDQNKLKNLNLENWDPELREEFANGLTRWAYRAIQENDIGAMGHFMTQTWGKVLSQFRTFMLVSHAKQFLHAGHTAIYRRDFQGAHAMMGTTFMGGMSYIAQQHAKNLGADDDDNIFDLFHGDWDDESKYSLKNLSTAAFQRSSYSSFIPIGVDTVWGDLTGFDPVFGHGRSTGLGGDIVTGSPSFDTLYKLGRLGAEFRDLAHGEDFDPAKLRALFYSNALGVHNIIERMSNE